MRYDTAEYASSRLSNSLVIAKVNGVKKPFFVDRVEGREEKVVIGWDYSGLNDTKRKTISIDDVILNEFDIGYLQADEGCPWFFRVPSRRNYKQGLTKSNVICKRFFVEGFFYEEQSSYRVASTGRVLSIKNIGNLMFKPYATFADAADMVEDSFELVAFNKDFAVAVGGFIVYCNNEVIGEADNSNNVQLYKDFEFMSEQLDAAIAKSTQSRSFVDDI